MATTMVKAAWRNSSPDGHGAQSANDLLYVADNDRMRRITPVKRRDGRPDRRADVRRISAGATQICSDRYIVNYLPDIIGLYSTVTQTYSALAEACYPPPPGSTVAIRCKRTASDRRPYSAIEFHAYSAITNEFYVSDNSNSRFEAFRQRAASRRLPVTVETHSWTASATAQNLSRHKRWL